MKKSKYALSKTQTDRSPQRTSISLHAMAFPRSKFIISSVKNVLLVFGIVSCYLAFENARNVSRETCNQKKVHLNTGHARRKLESNFEPAVVDTVNHKLPEPEKQSYKHRKSHVIHKSLPEIPCQFHQSKRQVQPVHGIDWETFKNKLYNQDRPPFAFLEEYKNPCWLEKLDRDYLKEYNNTLYFSPKRAHIKELRELFDRRLQSESPWRLRCLPYFFVAGITKSGTTDLYGTLMAHPDIAAGWLKEPMYWNRHRYPNGVKAHKGAKHPHRDILSYLNYYDWASHQINESSINTNCGKRHLRITGDASSYLFWEDNGWMSHPRNKGLKEPKVTTADAIHSINPETKFIVLLRDPSERVYSAYTMYANEPPFSYNRKADISSPKEFDTLVKKAITKYTACFKKHGIRACAYNVSLSMEVHPISLRASMYSVFVQDWYNVFPKGQFLFIRSEDYYADRTQYFQKIIKFLELSPVSPKLLRKATGHKPLYKRSYKEMWNVTRSTLQKFFKPYNQQVEKLLGIELWNS